MYVLLSRETSIDNLFLIGKYNRDVFKVNESALVECSRLWENRFDTIYTNYVDYNSFKVSLLNAQSLESHAADISKARRLSESDILCLTESQIANDTDLAELKEHLSTFEIHLNSCGVSHQILFFVRWKYCSLQVWDIYWHISY